MPTLKQRPIEEKKASRDWHKILHTDTIILDPDGWDRKNYEFSFNEELISKEEFERRLFYSTVDKRKLK